MSYNIKYRNIEYIKYLVLYFSFLFTNELVKKIIKKKKKI